MTTGAAVLGRREACDGLFLSLMVGLGFLTLLNFVIVWEGHILPVESDFGNIIGGISSDGAVDASSGPFRMSNTTLNATVELPLHPTAAICVVVRGEAQYLEEFIDYHIALGFDRIYVYDNSLDFELEHYSFTQTTIHHFPITKQGRQALGQKRCINNYIRPEKHTWVALIDVDEYIVLKQHSNIVDFLRDTCPEGSVSINWVRFGHANQTRYVNLPLTYRFQYRIDMSRIVKTIVHVDSYIRSKSPHWAVLRDNAKRRDPHGNWIEGDWFNESFVYNPSWNSKGSIDVAALHHYMYKSLEEYTQKRCVRGRMSNSYNETKLLCQNFTVDNLPAGDIFDDAAWQFLQTHVPKYGKLVRTGANSWSRDAASVDGSGEEAESHSWSRDSSGDTNGGVGSGAKGASSGDSIRDTTGNSADIREGSFM